MLLALAWPLITFLFAPRAHRVAFGDRRGNHRSGQGHRRRFVEEATSRPRGDKHYRVAALSSQLARARRRMGMAPPPQGFDYPGAVTSSRPYLWL
jgi:hypothetical protein